MHKDPVVGNSSESQRLLKIFENMGAKGKYATLNDVEILNTKPREGSPEHSKLVAGSLSMGMGETMPAGENANVSLHTEGSDRPYIAINRHRISSRYSNVHTKDPEIVSETNVSSKVKCYTLQEFYDNLRPEEKEKGEAWGKELESFA